MPALHPWLARAALASLIFLSGCRQGPIVIANNTAWARITVSPFSLTLYDYSVPGGHRLLATASGDNTDAYGAPGETHDEAVWIEQILSGWDGYQANEGPWTHAATAKVIGQSEHGTILELGSGDDAMQLDVELDGARLMLSLHMTAGTANKIGISFALDPDEHFFGLGERYTSVDHLGQSLYDWAEESGLGGGENVPASDDNPYPNGPSMTGFPVPFLLSTNGFGLALQTSARSEFHLGSDRPDQWRIASESRQLDMTVYIHPLPLDTINDFTSDVGRPAIPAPWAFGPRREVGRFDQVNGVPEWQALREQNVPTTALDDNTHFLPARSELGIEPALTDWTNLVHSEGFKVLAYITPYISTTLAPAADDLAYGMANHLFVDAADGTPLQVFFSSGEPQLLATIDLTNPAAVTWFQTLLQRPIDLGYDGWMHDFGEYVPHDALFNDGSVGLDEHNLFPLQSVRAAQALLDQEKPGDYFFYARSGWAGSGANVPGIWSGDPEATFDETQGIPAQLRAGLNLSMSGAPYWGSDIGGYKCLTSAPNDKEMYLRWAELGAVSPLMLNDTACATAIGPAKTKWTIWSDAETTQVYGQLALLHTRLAPYFQALAVQAHATGQPLMIHPFLLFPTRTEALSIDDAFFLGRALYAAPVVRRGEVSKDVWLPPGRYVDLRDFSLWEGDQMTTLPAPLDQLPLLLVDGQLLPMLDASVQTLAPASDASVVTAASVSDRLDVQLALSTGESAQLTLADGTQLSASRSTNGGTATIAMPTNPGGLALVDAANLSDCALCYRIDSLPQLVRLRANSSLANSSSLHIGDLILTANGPSARRIRWDAMELP